MAKVALVTGASGNGIGRSAALTLAREGFHLVINYRSNKEQAEKVCQYIRNNSGRAIAIQADVFIPEDCSRLIDEAIAEFDRLDVCIIGPGANWNPETIEKLDIEKSLQDIIQEIKPVYSLVPRVIAEMRRIGGGRVIAIASNPKLPSPSYSYNTAKNARISALLGLAEVCWKHKITVNVVCPGPVDHTSSINEAIDQTRHFPVSQLKITPQDIAEVIAFLCSEKGRYVTGNIIGTYF